MDLVNMPIMRVSGFIAGLFIAGINTYKESRLTPPNEPNNRQQ